MNSDPDELRTVPGSAESLFAAWAVHAEAGESAPFEDLLRAHPSRAEELAELHEDWQLFAPLLGKVVPGLIASDDFSVPPLSTGGEDEPGLPSPELLDRLGIHAPNTGRYRFRAVLGRGGGGVVLKVWDSKLNRPLAMKVVLGRGEERPSGATPRVDSRTLTRFVDEARIASQLNHPGIVPVHELGADESGRAFFTMKLVKGEELAKIFEKVKRGEEGWNPTRALGVLLKVCEAMSFAHAKGVIHRDLKPANVMVGRYGEVYVMDWGLARVLGEADHRDLRVRAEPQAGRSAVDSLRRGAREQDADSPLQTMDGDVVGTPSYMAPEQALGLLEEIGPHSDVYAVGAMLYHLLAGYPPYRPPGSAAHNREVWMAILQGGPASLAVCAGDAPSELVAICDRAMSRGVAERYTSMDALAGDLRAYLEGRVVAAYEAGPWAEARKWVRRNRTLATAGLGVLLLVVLLSIVGSSLYQQARARQLIEFRAARDHAQDRVLTNPGSTIKEKQQVLNSIASEILAGNADQGQLRRFLQHAWPRRLEGERFQRGTSLSLWQSYGNLWTGTAELNARETLEVSLRRFPGDSVRVEHVVFDSDMVAHDPESSFSVRALVEDLPPGRYAVTVAYTSRLYRTSSGDRVYIGDAEVFGSEPWEGFLLGEASIDPFVALPSSAFFASPDDVIQSELHWNGTTDRGALEFKAQIRFTGLLMPLEIGIREPPPSDPGATIELVAGQSRLRSECAFPIRLYVNPRSAHILSLDGRSNQYVFGGEMLSVTVTIPMMEQEAKQRHLTIRSCLPDSQRSLEYLEITERSLSLAGK